MRLPFCLKTAAETAYLEILSRCRPVADLAKECTIVFAMLYDDAALEQAVDSFLAAGPPKRTIFINCATV